jgi:2Fe-2S ferredoxin
MPSINYLSHTGTLTRVEAPVGMTVMRAAVTNDVPGIDADCGGACACATCHVIVDPDWADRLPPPETMEEDMLDVVTKLYPTSRLSCQITITAALDGLVVRTPESQR